VIAAVLVDPCVHRRLVLDVRFVSTLGERWQAVGVGCTMEEALEFAREGLPEGTWVAVSWDDLYGD
jgi:hypothetical protein